MTTDNPNHMASENDLTPDERLVQMHLERIKARVPITMPILVRQGDRYVPIDRHAASLLEAVKRAGVKTFQAYTIDNHSEEKLRQLRLYLAETRETSSPQTEEEGTAVSEKVRVYDTKTNTVTTTPAAELAPGMMQVNMEGIGEVFVNTAELEVSFGHSVHPPFTGGLRDLMDEFAILFAHLYPKTPEQWEDGFRSERNLASEIAIWLFMADVFRHFTASRSLEAEKQADILRVILAAVNNGPATALATTSPRTLSRKRAKEILQYVTQHQKEGLQRARVRAAAFIYEREGGVVTRPIDALVGVDGRLSPAGDPLPIVLAADIIIAVDVMTRREEVASGRKVLQGGAPSDEAGTRRVLKVELDAETDELERLAVLITAFKGQHELTGELRNPPEGDAHDLNSDGRRDG
jgi:hypothetical protein